MVALYCLRALHVRSGALDIRDIAIVQTSQALHMLLLPAKGAAADATLLPLSALLSHTGLLGDVRCGAGMSALHYVALQPRLLLAPGKNVTVKLLDLLLRLKPDVNGQVQRARGVHCMLCFRRVFSGMQT